MSVDEFLLSADTTDLNYPEIRPTLDLNFARTKTLDPRITFRRASGGSYVGPDGRLRLAGVNEARFTHNPVTGECLGLLVEEQRTNSIRNNTMVGAVAGTPGVNPTNWQFASTQSNGLTLSVVGTGEESGISYIDYRFSGTTVASPNGVTFGIDRAAAATGQVWTGSVYLRLVGGSSAGLTTTQLGLIETASDDSLVSGAFYTVTAVDSSALALGRRTATRTLSGGGTVAFCGFVINFNVTGNTAIDATVRIGLPQLERGAFATSVIPTSGTTATRSADVAVITGAAFSSWYRQDEGVIYGDWRIPAAPATGGARIFEIGNSTGNSQLWGRLQAGTNRLYEVSDAGVAQASFSQGSVAAGAEYRFAVGLRANDFGFSENGSISTDTSGTLALTMDRMGIGMAPNGIAPLNGTIRRLTYWPARLPNSTLQALTL